MFRLIKMCKANWPDYPYWQHVRFAPEPVAVMLLKFIKYAEQQMDLLTDFREYIFNNDTSGIGWGDLIQIDGRERAGVLIRMAENFLDRLPVIAYGVSATDDDEESAMWLFAVFSHVLDVNRAYISSILPNIFAEIEEAIPSASIHPHRSYSALESLPIDILRERGHEDLAMCLAYSTADTGNDYADYPFDEVIQFDVWDIDWETPGELATHRRLQQEAQFICMIYRSITDSLDSDIDGTMAFIAPLYEAIDEAHRRMDDAERQRTLLELLEAAAPEELV